MIPHLEEWDWKISIESSWHVLTVLLEKEREGGWEEEGRRGKGGRDEGGREKGERRANNWVSCFFFLHNFTFFNANISTAMAAGFMWGLHHR